MNVERYDSPLRWLVEARDRGHHLVDLGENDKGQCSCEDFTIRIEPFLRRGTLPPGGRITCKHIDAAREALLEHVIQRLREQ